MMKSRSSVRKSARLHRYEKGDILIYTVVTILGITMLYAFLNLVFQSLSPNWAITEANGMMLWPKQITLVNYKYVVKYPHVWNSYKNAIFVTLVGTSFSMILTILGGYTLSKRDLPGRMFITLLILITMWVSGGLIPNYLNLRRLGFLNSLWVMIIPDAISTSNLLLMRNYFLGMSDEIKESAYIDGANEQIVLVRIVLPLSMPIIATIGLFYGVSNWNEYTTPKMYNSQIKYHTIQVILQEMYKNSVKQVMEMDDIDKSTSAIATEAIKCATAVFATLPILLVYPLLQKYFVKGIMVGSLKG